MYLKIIFIFIVFLLGTTVQASTIVDSLTVILQESLNKNDKIKTIELYHEIGDEYYDIDEYNKAIESFQKSVDLSKKVGNNKLLSESLYKLGQAFRLNNNNPKALENYFAVLEIDSTQIKNTVKADSYSRIGGIYQTLGKVDESFNYQVKALKIYEENQDSLGISRIYYSLGTLFYYQDQNEEALKYYLKCKDICDKLKRDRQIYACLEALGVAYNRMKDYKKSAQYTKQSYELAKKINYKKGISYSLGNMAVDKKRKADQAIENDSIELANQLYAESEKLYLESCQLKEELQDVWGLTGVLGHLTSLYLTTGAYDKAQKTINRSEQLIEEIDSKVRMMNIYMDYSHLYRATNQPELALDYMDKYLALKDSVMNDKIAEEMGQSKNRYEIEKKESEIVLLKKENELFETNKELQKLQKYITSILAIFLMIVCYVTYSRLKYQKTTNALLEEKNEEINIQNIELTHTQDQLLQSNILLEEKNLLLADKNEEINSKNKLLESSNEDLAQFAYVASHDLKEPLRMISSYTTLLKRRYDHLYDDSGREFMHYVIDAAGRMENMLTDLLSYSRVGTQRDTRDWVDMEDIMVIVEANLRASLQENNAQLVFKAKDLPAVKANRTHMTQLLQNLVSNAIKFKGERDPIVEVDCTYDNELFTFSVKDNGIGITEENLKKVFEMFRRLHTRDEYEGTGIGLATCKKIVAKHGGDIWVESVYGEGCTFFFTIPCPVESPKLIEQQTTVEV